MSNYTTTLRWICESEENKRNEVESIFSSYKIEDYLTPDQIETIEASNTWSKEKLAKKIVNHYYFREIGFETYGLFKHYALEFMEELMEEYLPLIYSACIKYDPLVNVDFSETFERQSTGNSTSNGKANSNSNSTANGSNIFSNTPNVGVDNIKNGKYATNANVSESSSNMEDESITETQTNVDNSENYVKKTRGNSGVSATAQKMVEQFRDNIRAIDREIIEKCNILFMGLF